MNVLVGISFCSQLDVMAIPKLALHPGLLSSHTKDFWRDYPLVPWPEKRQATAQLPGHDSATRAALLVEQGRLGTAARVLSGDSKVRGATDAVINILHTKHPQGPTLPFGNGQGPPTRLQIDEEHLQAALGSFSIDTSPGISGWTVPLLRKAAEAPAVRSLLLLIARGMLQGSMVGEQMLCAARLTPLAKGDTDIRPIAVGDLIHRACAKTILKAAQGSVREALLPLQLGVGSKGGVEPALRAIKRALDGTLGRPMKYLTLLDFSNAFNAICRRIMARAIQQHCPELYRLAKWLYNRPTDLMVGSRPDRQLHSSQGVRQGDIFGPIFFSIAIRPLLDELQAVLGPKHHIVAYLDDITIVSEEEDALPLVRAFFEERDTSLGLNTSKSRSFELESVRQEGLQVLGSCLGSQVAKAAYLDAKISTGEARLEGLSLLPSQHALLLLRNYYSQDLRHLQRTMGSQHLETLWARWDSSLHQEVARIQGLASPSALLAATASLPLKMGGLGLLSHLEVAPLAQTAAREASDRELARIFPWLHPSDETQQAPPLSQRKRCQEALEVRRDSLVTQLDDLQRKALLEASSKIGRACLSTIPYNTASRLSNHEVATSLRLTMLQDATGPFCTRCAAPSSLYHQELCLKRGQWKIARHSAIQNALGDAFRLLQDSPVELEPHSDTQDRRRNDIRVSARSLGLPLDLDIKVVSLAAQHAY